MANNKMAVKSNRKKLIDRITKDQNPKIYNSNQSALQWNYRLSSHEYRQRRMIWGKYLGVMIKDLPLDYIKWGVLNFNNEWAGYLARELQGREVWLKKSKESK